MEWSDFKNSVEKRLRALERRVTALEATHRVKKTAEKSPIDDYVAEIVNDAAMELGVSDTEDHLISPEDDNCAPQDAHPEDDHRGPVLQYPHQFKKLASIEAENKNIDAFMANSTKVMICC